MPLTVTLKAKPCIDLVKKEEILANRPIRVKVLFVQPSEQFTVSVFNHEP
jgi:hypothetical protein